MIPKKVLSIKTPHHLLPSDQETNALLAIAATNRDLPRLKALAQTINDKARASENRDTANLNEALIMGSCFNEAKALLRGKKGEFGQWCHINVSVNDTQRRIYQRLDRNRDLIADQINTGVVSSIKGALKLITHRGKKDKPATDNLIGCATLPFGSVQVSKKGKEYYCLIFITSKRKDVANAYSFITGSDLPPDSPAEEADEVELLTPYTETEAQPQEHKELAKLAA